MLTRIEFPGALVLFGEESQQLATYNQTAALVWAELERGAGPAQVAAGLADAFSIEHAVAAADVKRITDQWRRFGKQSGTAVAAEREMPAFAVSGLGKPDELTIAVQSRCVRLRAHDRGLMRYLRAHLAGLQAEPPTGSRVVDIGIGLGSGPEPYRLWIDGRDCLSLASEAEAIGAALQHVLQTVYEGVSWLALIHGAAVTAPSGRAILLPGSGGSGKSTLAASLTRSGYGFLSDDTIALRAPDGFALPWCLPHSIKQGSWGVLGRAMPELAAAEPWTFGERTMKFVPVDPSDWDQPAAPVEAIVFPRYDPQGKPGLRRLEPYEALNRLCSDRVWLGNPMTRQRVEAFTAWLAPLPSYSARYSSLDQAHELVAAARG